MYSIMTNYLRCTRTKDAIVVIAPLNDASGTFSKEYDMDSGKEVMVLKVDESLVVKRINSSLYYYTKYSTAYRMQRVFYLSKHRTV